VNVINVVGFHHDVVTGFDSVVRIVNVVNSVHKNTSASVGVIVRDVDVTK